MSALDPPASPCVNVCRLDAHQVCEGCGRTLDEIAQWSSASDARKREILVRCAERRARGPDAKRTDP